MFKKYFRTGSIKATFWQIAKFGKAGLVDLPVMVFRWLLRSKRGRFIKSLKVAKLITEIIRNIHSLISYKNPRKVNSWG